jgi:ATP-dependent Lon protease
MSDVKWTDASTAAGDRDGIVRLPVLPLTSGVVLPGMAVTVAIESDAAVAAVEAATAAADRRLLLVPQVQGRWAQVGTVAEIAEEGRLPNGTRAMAVRGLHRAQVGLGLAGTGAALWVEATPVAEPPADEAVRTLAREVTAILQALMEQRGLPAQLGDVLAGIDEPGQVADQAAWFPDLSFAAKVDLLESLDVRHRLQLVRDWARERLADASLKEQIRRDVSEGMEKTQREYLLRQQMDAIRRELGEADGNVTAEYRARAADLELPDAVRTAVERELDRLERTGEQSPEHSWIRTWLDTVLELPWGSYSEERLDLDVARQVLDDDHTGLTEVKERIVEHLAVRKLRADRGRVGEPGAGAILVLVGPPGVGKTSLGASVARALGREYVRVALGGVRDEAEIRGHRRTYVGAQPGRIARALRDAGTMNPVFVLDEVDKLGADWRGDPSSALLEVLDPEQNHSFRDHYLEVELDLSGVLFLATANVAETIPGALLDRMEVIRLDGYTTDEKVAISRDHLLSRQLERAGLRPDEVAVTDRAIETIVTDHTREAGVRNLERELGKLARKAATIIAGGGPDHIHIDEADIRDHLGRPKFFAEAAERTLVPGVATGLAVTGSGGDVLFVEATRSDGESGLLLTGQLGDVMRESAQIALSWVRSAGDPGVPRPPDGRYHVHVPAGAVPKDGPSAGVTMATALVSLLGGRRVRGEVGMTGEVTLQGRVLPIGGVKQKVLAAHRAGLTEVILPSRNAGDLDDVPGVVRDAMTFHLVDDLGQVLAIALEPAAGLNDEVLARAA